MIITFAIITIALLFVFRKLQKNAFYMLYMLSMILSAYYCENYLNWHISIFSKNAVLLFLLFHIPLINTYTFIAYARDKYAAKRKKWRVPEIQLHTLELLGGTIGAILGQKILHHKNKKKSYLSVFFFTVILQICIIFFILIKLKII